MSGDNDVLTIRRSDLVAALVAEIVEASGAWQFVEGTPQASCGHEAWQA